jgi:hypothetical protein
MVTVFFSGAKLISLQALPPGARFTQEYFVNTIVPDIVDARREIFQRVRWGDFFVHMDNSMCHNGRKVADEFDDLKLDRVPHLPYSPDLSPCDFWLFGMLKHQIKDRSFRATEEILSAIRDLWNEVTSDQLQSAFFNWMRRLEYVIEHEGEYYIN